MPKTVESPPTSLIEVIPAHNESSHLRQTLLGLYKNSPVSISRFVVSENGSTDDTNKIVVDLCRDQPELFSLVTTEKADLGLALRNALAFILDLNLSPDEAGKIWVHFNGADIPFGTSDIVAFEQALLKYPDTNLFIGSKFHPMSKVKRGLLRKITSAGFFFLRLIVTGMAYRDTQGTLFFRYNDIKDFLPTLKTNGFITSTEIVYWHFINQKLVREISVDYSGEKRPSSVKLFKSAFDMFKQLLKLRTLKFEGNYYLKNNNQIEERLRS